MPWFLQREIPSVLHGQKQGLPSLRRGSRAASSFSASICFGLRLELFPLFCRNDINNPKIIDNKYRNTAGRTVMETVEGCIAVGSNVFNNSSISQSNGILQVAEVF